MTDPNYPAFVGLGSLVLSDLWHHWFLEENQRNGQPELKDSASLEAKIAIQEGKRGLPPGSRFWLDLNPTFSPAITSGKREEAGPNFIPWPEWYFEEFVGTSLIRSATLGEASSYESEGFVKIQAPDNPAPGGKYQNSLGYAPIFEYAGPKGHSAALGITAKVGGYSISLNFPWCIQQ